MEACLSAMEEYKDQWTNFLTAVEKERMKWSLETFPEATALSSLTKAKGEIEEAETNIKNDIKDPEEYVDILMCTFDAAGRDGISVDEIVSAYAVKFVKNKSRKWVKNPDNTYSHIK